MAKNLRLGSKFIRFSLIGGFIVAVAGVYCASSAVSLTAGNEAAQRYVSFTFAALVLNGIFFIGVFWMLAARKVVKRVNVLAAAMDRGAEGDLTTRLEVTAEDEIGKLNTNFNVMMERLAGVVGKVMLSAGELRKIATDINEVAKQGVTSAELQSEGVNGASGAVLEINRSVNQIVEWVENLTGSATDNASSILELSASIEEVNQHVEALGKAVEEVSASIFEMAAAEKEIGGSVNNLMNDSNTATSLVEGLDISIKQVEKNALQTAAISETVKQDAEMGREAVEATISGIGEIRSSSRITVEAIENLTARAVDIGKILSVIDEVAEQTNLLALNASIIAAQAGEHGKGFAVVAEEIKELARRSSISTKEIAGIIKGVQEETRRASSAIKLSEQRIAEGEVLSQRSGEALHKIVAGVLQATSQVNEIARTTVEQSKGSQKMRQAIERVVDMVRQIARATREQGHGSELITAAAERMKNLTGQVRVSTRAQRETGDLIVHATEDITTMIGNIGQACEAQAESSRRIVQAMENIRHSTRTNVESTRVMDGAVDGLSSQVKLLQQEMAGFKV
jgi:methyl-accepting chemotaxis protein